MDTPARENLTATKNNYAVIPYKDILCRTGIYGVLPKVAIGTASPGGTTLVCCK